MAIAPRLFDIEVEEERPAPKSMSPWFNPTQFERPAFMMNFPFSFATDAANNAWMEEMKEEKM